MGIFYTRENTANSTIHPLRKFSASHQQAYHELPCAACYCFARLQTDLFSLLSLFCCIKMRFSLQGGSSFAFTTLYYLPWPVLYCPDWAKSSVARRCLVGSFHLETRDYSPFLPSSITHSIFVFFVLFASMVYGPTLLCSSLHLYHILLSPTLSSPTSHLHLSQIYQLHLSTC
jgi:hypothetical protein